MRASFTAQLTALQSEVDRLRTANNLLVERARRTDDDVRERAALEPEWRRQVGRWEERFELRDAEAEEAERDAEEKGRKVRRLKRKLEDAEDEIESVNEGKSCKSC